MKLKPNSGMVPLEPTEIKLEPKLEWKSNLKVELKSENQTEI